MCEFKAGDKVFAKGFGPEGEAAWFEAVVLAVRKRFPPINVSSVCDVPWCF